MNERQIEITSSGWLFKPEQLFWLVGHLNNHHHDHPPIGVELYPVHYFNGWPMGPGRIDAKRIREWQNRFGNVPIERIHLPFHYSLPLALKNYFYTSIFQEPGTFKNRVVASGVAYMTTTVQNMLATRLAENFNAGLNAHVHIIEEAAKRHELTKIRGQAKYVWVENDTDYPRINPVQQQRQRDPLRAIRAVRYNGLDGIILGIDHDFWHGYDPMAIFEKYSANLKGHLRAVHLAGSTGHHGLISHQDRQFWDFIRYIKKANWPDVRFCLDLNPFEVQRLNPVEQLELVYQLVNRLRD